MEPQAERIVDKARSNFCDFFRVRELPQTKHAQPSDEETAAKAKAKLESLFKK
jgi:hypothetical protein